MISNLTHAGKRVASQCSIAPLVFFISDRFWGFINSSRREEYRDGKMCLVFSDPAVGEDFYLIFVLDEANIANTVRPGYDDDVVITVSRSSKIISLKWFDAVEKSFCYYGLTGRRSHFFKTIGIHLDKLYRYDNSPLWKNHIIIASSDRIHHKIVGCTSTVAKPKLTLWWATYPAEWDSLIYFHYSSLGLQSYCSNTTVPVGYPCLEFFCQPIHFLV